MVKGRLCEKIRAGRLFRKAVKEETPLQVVGTITAYTARMGRANRLQSDLLIRRRELPRIRWECPISGSVNLEDVITDARRITEVCSLPLLVDIDTGWGGAFNIARTIRQMIRANVAAVHLEDQISAKRCGHRPRQRSCLEK